MSGPDRKNATTDPGIGGLHPGERVLTTGEYHRMAAWVSLPIGIIGLVMALWFIISGTDTISQTMPFLDILMLVTSAYAIFFAIRELFLFRRRCLTLTAERVFGHDGRQPFDVPLLDIRSVTEETTRSLFVGSQTELVIQDRSGKTVRISQLKNRESLQITIRKARDQARETIARPLST